MNRYLSLAFLALTGGEVLAEEPQRLEPVQVTAGRHQESAYEVPQPVTVLTREEIEAHNPQVMTQALRDQPGAFFQQTGPGQGIVIVRGLKGSEVLHLVDGMRLNNAFFRTAPSQYIALLDPQNIAQLELVRGPYATVYGSDAMGGVVQVLTPEYRFGGEQWDWRGGAGAHYASADLAQTFRAYAAGGDKNLSLSAGFSFADYGQRRLAEPGQSPDGMGGFTLRERVADTDYLSRGYDFKAVWNLDGGDELMFSSQYFTLPALPRYNETVPGYRQPAVPAVAISIYDNNRTFHHLRYRHSAPLAFMDQFELHLAHQIISDDRLDRRQDNGRDTFEFNRSKLTGLTAQASTLSAAHTLQYGAEWYSDRVDSRSVRETPPGSGEFSFNSAAGFQSRFPDGSRADELGLYLLDEWAIAQSWILDLGARYSRHETTLAQADRPFGAELDDDDLTGNLGLRWAISPGLAWTLNLGRGYRAPNINDLALVGRRAGNRVVVANYDLKPESLVSVDTGFKFAGAALSGEATLFYSRYRDRITLENPAFAEGTPQCPDDSDTATDGCAQNQNIEQAMYYGFEGGLRHVFSPQLALRGVLNYTFGQEENRGQKTPGNRVPPLNGQLALEWQAQADLSLESQLVFADAQDRLDNDDLADARINPQGTPGYALLNLRSRWTLNPTLALQLDGTNLLNQSYREHGSGINGAARGVGLTAEMKFGS